MQVLPLPAELLFDIFLMATENPLRDLDRFVDMPPFESVDFLAFEKECSTALKTKHSLALTCFAFKNLSIDLMYEDIRVRYGSSALADILEGTGASFPGSGLGNKVKRAVLFAGELEDESPTFERVSRDTRRILKCCPNIRAILRPKSTFPKERLTEVQESTNSHDESLLFPSLQRVDWTSCPSDDPPMIAQIPHSVWSSESLISLSVGVKEWSRFTSMQETETTRIFSNIRTLRVRSLDAFGVPGQRLFSLELPCLRRLVLDQPDSMYALFSVVKYSKQIRTLELGLHPGFLEHDYIAILLIYCQDTEDLFFPVFTTRPTRNNDHGMPHVYSIKRVTLHAAVNDESDCDESWKYQQLTEQFETLCGNDTRFVRLEQIILHGSEWKSLVCDPRLRPSLRLASSKGVNVSCTEEEVEQLLRIISMLAAR